MLVPGSRGFVVLLGALTGVTALSVDMSLPAMPVLTRVFATTPDRTQLTLSLFLLGFAVGQLFYGPLSDRFGRKPLLIGGLAIYTLAGIGCALASSIGQLVLLRLLQGLGACVGRVLVPAVVRDEFEPRRGAQLLSYVMLVVGLAPLVAPIIGGYLLRFLAWPAIFAVLAAFGAAVLLATAAWLGESIKWRNPEAVHPAVLLRNYGRFLTHRTCLGYALIGSFAFAGMFSYISGSPFVLIEVFGVATDAYGYFFALNAVAFMVGALLNGRLLRRRTPHQVLRLGLGLLVAAGALLFLCGILRWGGIAGIVVPMMGFATAVALILPNATAAAMEPVADMAGVASSLLGSLQMLSGSLAGYAVGAFYDGTATAMATCVGLAALLTLGAGLLVRPARI
jgi:DHA1 family bicyclomycin/chloramphenicol resistance-like MFS transporter